MNRTLHKIVTLVKPETHVIFDLDKTIWNMTLEYQNHISLHHVKQSIDPFVGNVLEAFKRNGNTMHIASRSASTKKCKSLLRHLFPQIAFETMEIYPTERHKDQHIDAILKNRINRTFIMFDDDEEILDHLSKQHKCVTIHCEHPINQNTFDEKHDSIMYQLSKLY